MGLGLAGIAVETCTCLLDQKLGGRQCIAGASKHQLLSRLWHQDLYHILLKACHHFLSQHHPFLLLDLLIQRFFKIIICITISISGNHFLCSVLLAPQSGADIGGAYRDFLPVPTWDFQVKHWTGTRGSKQLPGTVFTVNTNFRILLLCITNT